MPDLLSKSELAIYELMTKRISEKQPITTDDIMDTYFDTISVDNKILIRWNLGSYMYGGKTGHAYLERGDSRLKQKALTWFKQNLAGCIIKGKLLVIPIIEIDS